MATDVREADSAPLDLHWLNPGTEWGVRARPGKRGLTLDEINVGSYGQAPDHVSGHSYLPRGAAARPDAPRIGYGVRDKSDVWAENCAFLYEEAVQRQWSSATDIPWHELTPLPDDIERAVCQFCTYLTEVEFIAGDIPGKWVPKIPAEYMEAKLFLSSQIMDEARHTDVFRKRALANGGGLMRETGAAGLRNIADGLDFTEMSAIMHVLSEGFVQSLFRCGEWLAQNDVEKRIFRMCGQDESRHLAFGVMHLKYLMEKEPQRREEIHSYLDKAEGMMFTEIQDPSLFEAIAILLGGGRDRIDEGYQKFLVVRKKQVNEYMHRLEVAGLRDRRERMGPFMAMFLDPSKN
jgi:hypothetical protein